MQTYTTDTDNNTATAGHALASPLMLHAVPASRRRGLTAGVSVRPVMRETTAPACDPGTAARLARLAVSDERSTDDRVVDRVVDGLMAELGWGRAATPRRRS